MSRLDPNLDLARRHASHHTPHFACPMCMRAKRAEQARWNQPRRD